MDTNKAITMKYSKEITKYHSGSFTKKLDNLAVEHPLEIQLAFEKEGSYTTQPIYLTMRTPGNDHELAIGLLFSEGVINSYDEIKDIHHFETWPGEVNTNTVIVRLQPNITPRLNQKQVYFPTNSSCGLCGKLSLRDFNQLPIQKRNWTANIHLSPQTIVQLPELLRTTQTNFNVTGGLHAIGVFSFNGNLQLCREDVGRHNAMDKVIGNCLQQRISDLESSILLLSGRISFELIQKAARLKCPLIVAIGAPSSLACELAELCGITLIGFTKQQSFNIYTHPEQIEWEA